MAGNNTLKILQANVQHQQTNKISFYNNIGSEDPDILLLNEHRVRENGKIKIYGYKTEWKNLNNQARDGAAIAIKSKIKHRIINNLSNNTVACKIHTNMGPVIITTAYIPPRRPIIPRADFDKLITALSMCWVILMETIDN